MATVTLVPAPARHIDREHRFFLNAAIVMTLVIFAGFSLQLAAGRSTFASPLFLHVHAFIFFDWTVLYLTQNALVTSGSVRLHRRLGWLATIWIPAIVFMGIFVTIHSARAGRTPFFFQPAYFVLMNTFGALAFAALAVAAIALRRRKAWHKRLMFCAMTILLGPGIGRILPMPLLIPYAGEAVFAVAILFPAVGIIHDLRANGRIHPAWFWGIGTILALQVGINAATFSPIGSAYYRSVTANSPGASVAPGDFPLPPWLRPAAARHKLS